ncbi:MAG: anti-sigma factor antagonist [Thermoleophilaceae bacterium]|nr:anti-sigma factor antagonist [Thermoleophilaceae bacterium]
MARPTRAGGIFRPLNSSSPFGVTIEQRGSAVHVALTGELDISTAQRLEDDLRRVEADGPELIVLDLQQLSFMDSTGLRLLIMADARAREADRQLAIVRGNEMVHRVMRLTRLDERLNIVEDPGALSGA